MTSRSRWYYAAISLLVLSVIGIWNAYDEWADAATAGQRLATMTEIGYGVLGPLSALALTFAWRATRWLLSLWAVCLGMTAGLAPLVWGEAPLWTGILSAITGGLAGVLVMWMSRQEKRAKGD